MKSRNPILKLLWLGLICFLVPFTSLFAQHETLLPDSLVEEIILEVSGEKAWWHVNELSQYHRIQASLGYHESAMYIVDKAKQYGLTDVHIEKFVADGKKMNFMFRTSPSWDGESGKLWMIEPEKKKLADFDEIKVSLAVYSRNADVTAELVDVGKGESPQDYKNVDVEGKLVLASGNPGAVHQQAVYERGALGILSYYTIAWQNTRQPGDYPDQVTWGSIEPESKNGQQSTFGFMLSYRTGTMLKKMLAEGQKIVLKAEVRAKVHPGYYEVVTGLLPGTRYPDQELVLIAHLDHYRPGANDNASGSAMLLEIARSIQNLIAKKKIKPPLRSIRFMWVPEIHGTVPYLANHPEAFDKMFSVINLDMVGSHHQKAKSIFHLTQTPHSLPGFLNEVTRSFTQYAIVNNQERFAMDKTSTIISPTGTRDNFYAGIEKYGGGSDHYIFTDGAIGIPAVMMGTWPDVYYHTNEDTPDKVDPTTLRRAGFIATASTIYLTGIASEDVPALAMETVSNARERIAEDEKKAFRLLESYSDRLQTGFREAKNVIHQGFIREGKAIASCSYFAEKDQDVLNYLDQLKKSLLQEESSAQNRLKRYYHHLCSVAGIEPSVPELTSPEKRLSTIIPQRVMKYAGPLRNDFLKTKLGEDFDANDLLINQQSQTGMVVFQNIPYETLNFVDGERSILAIRNAVSAEYKPVSLEAVEEYLKTLQKAGIITLK